MTHLDKSKENNVQAKSYYEIKYKEGVKCYLFLNYISSSVY